LSKPSKIIAVEEHFVTSEFAVFSERQAARLRDFETIRLEDMDRYGIDMQVLSISGTVAIQNEQDEAKALDMSRRFNDVLAKITYKYPKRFAAFAALPMNFPAAAAMELDRCVTQVGMKGSMVRNHVNGEYLDSEKFLPFWDCTAGLGVPVYLHPFPPPVQPKVFDGFPELSGAVWGWATETSSHALRIVCSGIFDRFPSAKLILGHMAEMLPFGLQRMDVRWKDQGKNRRLKMAPSQYIKDNVLATTSGVFSNAPLLCTIDALGPDSVLFATDYPQEELEPCVEFLSNAPVGQDVIEKIAHGNAERILHLQP